MAGAEPAAPLARRFPQDYQRCASLRRRRPDVPLVCRGLRLRRAFVPNRARHFTAQPLWRHLPGSSRRRICRQICSTLQRDIN